jgi:hypothetical protein
VFLERAAQGFRRLGQLGGEERLDGRPGIQVDGSEGELDFRVGGTRLTYTEQGAFLDGIDKPGARKGGIEWMLDNLGGYLTSRSAG